MKKMVVLFLLLLIVFNINNKDVVMVFDEKIEYSNLYEITFTNNLSTNNFLNYFSNIKVIWIRPKMNVLYKKQLSKYNKYYFKEISNEKNINIFKNEYINYINKLGYKNESIKLQTSGIMIEKIKVYLSSEELYYIKSVLSDVKMENA